MTGPLAALDVDYRDADRLAVAACVLFRNWSDADASGERVAVFHGAAPYVPGELYRRELPALLAVLREVERPRLVLVDGYVWLDGARARRGLGAHLHEALGGTTPVVGVAKNRFVGAAAVEVLRGESARPLFVTAIGVEPEWAADRVREMRGVGRLPTLLKRADQLCRREPA